MGYRSRGCAVAVALASLCSALPAQAQLFWKSPDYKGAPVVGNEPGVVIPLPGATPAELNANLVWTLRAGLNVAALQCQFAPALMTVRNYNDLLTHHAKELNADYKMLQAYFTRVTPKSAGKNAAAAAFDRYTTSTYNSFSTLNAQIGFCQTASRVGLAALMEPKGKLIVTARDRLRELRNSLVPVGDYLWQKQPALTLAQSLVPDFPPDCYDRKGELKKRCLRDDK